VVIGLAVLLFQGLAASPSLCLFAAGSACSRCLSSRPASDTKFSGNTCAIASCNIRIITQRRGLSRLLISLWLLPPVAFRVHGRYHPHLRPRELPVTSRWCEIRACNNNACGESKSHNSPESLLDLTVWIAATNPKVPIYWYLISRQRLTKTEDFRRPNQTYKESLKNVRILLANSNQRYFNNLVKRPCHKTP
jgi:hypothetical protein